MRISMRRIASREAEFEDQFEALKTDL